MAATNRHAVWLYEKRIGWLFHHDNYTWFEFRSDYLTDRDRPVLGLRFEENLNERTAANLKLPPWFSNLLPEGILRDWIAADRKVSPDREMELLTQVGHDLPGAVRVFPDGAHPVEDIAEITKSIGEAEYTSRDGHPEWKFSLAGVAIKFSMLRHGDKFSCTATGEGGDWILKLPDPIFSHVPKNEYTMMRFAQAVGIVVPEVSLVHRDNTSGIPDSAWRTNEEYCYAVRRFDRGNDGKLIHIEDLAQVRGMYPINKYQGNFETVASLIYRQRDSISLDEFVRRLVFFVLIGNGDAHLKNWSLIYRDRRVPTLSPAYDIVSTEAYPIDDRPEDLGMKFAGNRRFEAVRIHHFERLARKLGTSADLASTARETIAHAMQHWPRFAEELRDHRAIRDSVEKALSARSRSLQSAR
jgi:serine/threonine-protein kinase HipA